MTKVHKVVMYVIDHEEMDEERLVVNIKNAVDRRLDIYPMIMPLESSQAFEWDDDLKINYNNATEKDYQNVIKGRPEYDRT